MIKPLLFAFLVISASVTASSLPLVTRKSTITNGITTDAPFSLSQEQLNSVHLYCPNGVKKAASKNILYIHGTAGTGEETWPKGLLPAFHEKGFNGCYVNLPDRTLGDAQLTSEYVVSAIQRLYRQAGNNSILLVGYSQGNLNIQWALNFWPSTREMVANYVSLSGDFQGTSEGPFVTSLERLLTQGAIPSILQQSVFKGKQSNYLQALNKRGNIALVPTTSVYGIQDEIIQPVKRDTELGHGGAAFTHVSIQELCPLMLVGHFAIIINRVAFYLALDAFIHGGAANVRRVKATYKDICHDEVAPDVTDLAIPATLQVALLSQLSLVSQGGLTPGGPFSQRVKVEPKLQAYATQ